MCVSVHLLHYLRLGVYKHSSGAMRAGTLGAEGSEEPLEGGLCVETPPALVSTLSISVDTTKEPLSYLVTTLAYLDTN